eukprot:Transcript_5490.p4 GENE.Transcript_5490~~Transcript_5490.p4  ORF type:complete len:138 (+),score=29.54 Transcript_5490:1006-1419(+)
MCDYLKGDGKRCLGWCNTYTCGINDCDACGGVSGAPNCLDTSTFCESWCNKWTCNSPYCTGCSMCDACTCKSSWTTTDTGCTTTQSGCPSTACDGDSNGPWCLVDSTPCAGSSGDGSWMYCTPGRRLEDEQTMVEEQ